MELTAFAAWLNRTFFDFDYSILSAIHDFAVSTEGRGNAFFAAYGAILPYAVLTICLVTLLFKKSRPAGVSAFIALVFVLCLCNLLLKNLIMRPRPFYMAETPFPEWWKFAGAIPESEYSFPSGHMSILSAVLGGIYLELERRKYWWLFLFILLMAVCRCYLCVHYPSDVIAGVILGTVCAFIGSHFSKSLYARCHEHPEEQFSILLLEKGF